MSFGRILLVITGVLLLFGIGQRVLDRMRMRDRTAILMIILILIGGLINIPLGEHVSLNVGGALIPAGICIYLFAQAGTTKEKVRAVISGVLTGTAVLLTGMFFPDEPETMPLDVNYVYGLLAALVAYVSGRSRISAFIGGVMGVLLADIVQAILSASRGTAYTLNLGGAGAMDTVVLSGFGAVLLCEIVGTAAERMKGRGQRHAKICNGRQVLVTEEKER